MANSKKVPAEQNARQVLLVFRLFRPELAEVDNNLHGLLHGVQRAVLEFAVEVHTSGKDIRARQPHKREACAIGSATNWLYDRRNICLNHRLLRQLDNLWMRLNHLAHIVVLVFEGKF